MERVFHKPLGWNIDEYCGILLYSYGAKPQYPKILVSLCLDQSGTS